MEAGFVSADHQRAYESLQVYMSKARRQAAAGDPTGAVRTAASGACELATFPSCAVELGKMMIKMVDVPRDAVKEGIKAIDTALVEHGAPEAERQRLLKAVVRWSMSQDLPYGDHEILSMLAASYIESCETTKAVNTLVMAEEPMMVSELVKRKLEGGEQVEALVAQAVLHFLALENMRDANRLLDEYNKASRGPLVTFAESMCQLCERNAAPLFNALVNTFKPHLDEQPDLAPLIQTIGTKLHGIPPPAGLMSMLSNAMAMLGS